MPKAIDWSFGRFWFGLGVALSPATGRALLLALLLTTVWPVRDEASATGDPAPETSAVGAG